MAQMAENGSCFGPKLGFDVRSVGHPAGSVHVGTSSDLPHV